MSCHPDRALIGGCKGGEFGIDADAGHGSIVQMCGVSSVVAQRVVVLQLLVLLLLVVTGTMGGLSLRVFRGRR